MNVGREKIVNRYVKFQDSPKAALINLLGNVLKLFFLFFRAFGFSLAIFGIGMIVTAFVKSCKNLSEETLNLVSIVSNYSTL